MQRVMIPLAARYKGTVTSIRQLRPCPVIKDDAIPMILSRQRRPTFVTTNVTDFWRRIEAHPRFCVIAIPLPTSRHDEIPPLLFRFFRNRLFRTTRQRMGKVLRLTAREIAWYQTEGPVRRRISW